LKDHVHADSKDEAPPFVHATAVVDAGAVLGAGCQVWHFCHVMAGARVGAGSALGQNVYVGGAAVVGERCKIANNVSLYDAVELQDDVFVGPAVVFTNVKTPRAFVSRKHAYQPTVVEQGASIGANATIVCGHRLGAYCLIGAGAVVTSDVPPYALFTGVPARRSGWVCRCGEKLPASGDGEELSCAACGDVYRLRGERLTPQKRTSQSTP
jgi:UDP-2-acetamido-3-amino-2,3-dideoxy-glucuronate N-acetyltransferase